MSDLGQGFEVDDVTRRIANAFAVYQLGVVIDQFGDGLGGVVAGEAHIDAKAWQQMGKQGVGAAVELRSGDNIVTGSGQGLDRIVDRGTAGRDGQGRDTAFEGGNALL
ncbi:hypothetical protein D3C85_1670670 [compost metagenome]